MYGSSRLGILGELTVGSTSLTLVSGYGSAIISKFTRGEKFFELSNHLGNVLVTVSDKKIHIDGSGDGVIDLYKADVVSANDYAPFGMLLPGRKYSSGLYRYGFNGKENDNDVKGEGNQQDYGMRIYDTRLGKFLSVDPIANEFPWYSPYHFSGNNPIRNIDLDGEEPQDYMRKWIHKTMTINSARISERKVEYDKSFGSYSYEAIYDQVSRQNWFVMQKSSDPTFYYWKHIDGADPNRLIQSETGKQDNGSWQPFLTADAEQARIGAESADLLSGTFAALFTAPFAIHAYGTVSVAVGGTYIGRGIFDASTDITAQLATNGGSLEDVNRTSVVLSFFVPGNSIKTLLAKNAVANYGKWTGDGYKGIGSNGYTISNFGYDGLNTFVGAGTDKLFGVLGNRPTANSQQLSRWKKLSYKPKYLNMLQQNNRISGKIISSNHFLEKV